MTIAGANVLTAQSAPSQYGYDPAKCVNLGHIVAHSGDDFGAPYTINDVLIERAMNNLRNQAAERGGNFIQHDAPHLGNGRSNGIQGPLNATVTGTAWRCEGAPGDAKGATAASGQPGSAPMASAVVPASSAAPAPKETAHPVGAAGFRFGDSVAACKDACVAAGFQWNIDSSSGSCGGIPAKAGLEGTSQVLFCEATACGIDMVGAVQKLGEPHSFHQLEQILVKKYGRPRQVTELPTACAGDEVACVAEGKGELRRAWLWSNQFWIELAMLKSPEGARISLHYGTPSRPRADEKAPAL